MHFRGGQRRWLGSPWGRFDSSNMPHDNDIRSILFGRPGWTYPTLTTALYMGHLDRILLKNTTWAWDEFEVPPGSPNLRHWHLDLFQTGPFSPTDGTVLQEDGDRAGKHQRRCTEPCAMSAMAIGFCATPRFEEFGPFGMDGHPWDWNSYIQNLHVTPIYGTTSTDGWPGPIGWNLPLDQLHMNWTRPEQI